MISETSFLESFEPSFACVQLNVCKFKRMHEEILTVLFTLKIVLT